MGSMAAFVDELSKLSQAPGAPGKALEVALKYWKPAGLVGAGAAGMHYGGKEVDKYRMGRQMYARMHGE